MYLSYGQIDPGFLLVIGAMILGLIASGAVQRTFTRYSRVGTRLGLTGEQMARRILDNYGLTNVRVERVAGRLTDHYDPRSQTLRLSESVYGSTSVAALGVAAHESGHAVQHAFKYRPVTVRNALVPMANLGSQLLIPAMFAGIMFGEFGGTIMLIGAVLYGASVAFHLVTLPVEFDASNRAVSFLQATGGLTTEELGGVKKVLRAAGMTYVAAALASLANMIRLIMLGRRR
ncbi:MAG TPA: zinc metallopeptidase [Candidatus Fermentibacter daniensis]|nr:zinc metallopeptidase [Candidatus Fermentibacter daniensis]HPN61876.1 zinc metallopeptidase [Candidatus Fermentibacter daniensis]